MRGTSNLQAFKAYLEGERQFSVTDQASMDTAIQYFRDAIALDPDFARAHGYLSYALVRSALTGWRDRAVIAAEGLEAAEKAVDLDHQAYKALQGVQDDVYEACDYAPYWDLAFALLNIEGRIPDSIEQYEKALYLYDNLTDRLDRKPGLLAEAAVAFIQAGDVDRALGLVEKSKLIPGWYRWNHGFAHYMDREPETALTELQHEDLNPDDDNVPPEVSIFVACALVHGGDVAAAQKAMDRYRALRPDSKLDDVKSHWRFSNPDDEQYWTDAIDQAWV